MRLKTDLALSQRTDDALRQLVYLLRDTNTQVNQITEGTLSGFHNAYTSPPVGTTQQYKQGDRILNSAPSVLGSAGSQYVVTGWICVASGAPGTWVQMRTLTGT